MILLPLVVVEDRGDTSTASTPTTWGWVLSFEYRCQRPRSTNFIGSINGFVVCTGTNRISWQDFPRLTYRCLFRFATRSIKFFITKRDILWYANFYENSPLWSHLSTISTQGILERKMPIWIVPAWNSSEKDEADTRRNMVHVTLLSRLCRGRIAILCNTAQCPQGPQQ